MIYNNNIMLHSSELKLLNSGFVSIKVNDIYAILKIRVSIYLSKPVCGILSVQAGIFNDGRSLYAIDDTQIHVLTI